MHVNEEKPMSPIRTLVAYRLVTL